MHVSARADYATRALVELAASEADGAVSVDRIAGLQGISAAFLANILQQLRIAGFVRSVRGSNGGYLLDRPAAQITLADVIRAIDGPLTTLADRPPEDLDYQGAAAGLSEVWVAARVSLRNVLEHTTIADVARRKPPTVVRRLAAAQGAWHRR